MNGCVIAQTPSLEKGDSVRLILGVCDYTYFPIHPLSLIFSLYVCTVTFCLISFQNHVLNYIKIH